MFNEAHVRAGRQALFMKFHLQDATTKLNVLAPSVSLELPTMGPTDFAI